MAVSTINENPRLFEDYLIINCTPNGKPLRFNYFWLRDHCRCRDCYNIKTHQRIVNLLNIPFNINVDECNVQNGLLHINWSDGHKSEFSLNWLSETNYDTKKIKMVSFPKLLWTKNTILKNFEHLQIPKERFLTSMQGVKDLLMSIKKFGIGFVTNVDTTLKETENIAKRIGPIQHTFFGGMWEVKNTYIHDDMAYDTTYLGAHTDNTYFTNAAGLQIFHMLHQNGSGGQTLLVDGFQAASALRNKDPAAFEILNKTCIEAEYIESGVHYTHLAPVITTHPITNELQQIRYNVNDRSPMVNIPMEETMPFYKAYCKFGAEITNGENELWIHLKPGMILFIDNWRVLHGRAEFEGERHLGGCYISRCDWLSKAKSMGL